MARKIAALFLSLLIFSSQSANASNAVQDAWGFATDPIGLDRSSKTLSDSLQRALIQLQALEGVANYDVQQRLEQIRSIVRDALNGTQAIIDDAASKMLTLEAQINSDAINLLYQVECLTNTVLNDQLQQAFSNFISNVKKADPSITIFGYHLVGVSIVCLTRQALHAQP